MNFYSSSIRNAFSLAISLLFTFTSARAQSPTSAISSDYKVAAEDVITIAVVNEKDLTQDCKVTSSGTITFAWLNNFEVVGKTPSQIEQSIRTALDKDYLVNPTVIVALKEYHVREVNVFGEVNKPGAVAIPSERPMTIVDAISKAQGFTARGNPNKIEFTPKRTGKKITLRLDDLKAITDPSKNYFVEPGDLIEIGQKVL